MDGAEFDKFAEEYDRQHAANIAITGESPAYFAEYKIKLLQQRAAALGLEDGAIIDFGAGIGNSVPHMRRWMPRAPLVSADVSQRSLDLAKARFGDVGPLLLDGQSIPAEDGQFAVAFSACVFHHVPDTEHEHWLRELRRVTRPGGLLMIFEHNPLNPLTVRAVNTCPFDVNARLIRAGRFADRARAAGWSAPRISYHLFFPRLLSALRNLEPHLARVPLGAQYAVTAVRPR